jgi:hypothetical protein
MPLVGARPRLGITAAVVEAAQFLFQVVRPYRSTDIEIERFGVDTRRHGPMPTLEFPGHDTVEINDPGGGDGCERAQCAAREDEYDAPATRLGAAHARLRRSFGKAVLDECLNDQFRCHQIQMSASRILKECDVGR